MVHPGVSEQLLRSAKLRTGVVELKILTQVDRDDGSTGSGGFAGEVGRSGPQEQEGPYRDEEAWRGLPSLRLYLVGYDPRQPQALGEALEAHGASVLSYVPDDTWLVAATPQAMLQVSKKAGAQAAPYKAELRLAPEWAPLEVLLAPGEGAQGGRSGDETRTGAKAGAGDAYPPGGFLSEGGGMPPDGWDASPPTAGVGARRALRSTAAESAPGVGWKGSTTGRDPAMDRRGHVAAAVTGGSEVEGKGCGAVLSRLLSSLRTLDSTPLHPAVGGRLDERRRRRRQLGGAGAGEPPAPPRYGVWVQLAGVVPAAALQAAEEDWPGALDRELGRGGGQGQVHGAGEGGGDGCQPVVVAPRSGRTGEVLDAATGAHGASLEVFFCEEDLRRGLRWLARQPLVTWVAPLEQLRANDAFSGILVQTGGITPKQVADPFGGGMGARPYHAYGLRGNAEILGVGDTGLDLRSCYLADSRYSNDYTGRLVSDGRNGNMTRLDLGDHRKLVQYVVAPGAGYRQDDLIHGTHVAGIAVGALESYSGGPDLATGAAPMAKISFVDVGNGGTSVTVPYPIETNYLPMHADAGAETTSDSWGGGSAYSIESAAYDLFLWRNPMVSSFLAAGNAGSDAPFDGSTVNYPANAKNVIAVGAGYKWNKGDEVEVLNAYTVRGTDASGAETFTLNVWPTENEQLPLLSGALPGTVILAVASAQAACNSMNGVAAKGAVVLVPRGAAGACTWTDIARAVQRKGGLALMAADDGLSIAYTPPDPVLASGQQVPCSIIRQRFGQWIYGNATRSARMTIARVQALASTLNVAPFSSYGPLPDDRVKPDVIAPGVAVVSALGYDRYVPDGTCSGETYTLSGTSMACPSAAGHAAIMRQYFKDGFYPDGRSDSPNSVRFKPSGMLIKALVIAGAQSMQGGQHLGSGGRLGPSPDGLQGWGRMSLAGSLPLPGATSSGFRLQVADMMQFTATGQSVTLGGLAATGSGPVTVVLVWYDYPADLTAASALVNDLDLEVAVGSGANTQRVLGNNAEGAASPAPDRVNSVERVVLARPPAGAQLAVTVRAAALRSALLVRRPDAGRPQRFAVAAVGHFTGSFAPPATATSGGGGGAANGTSGASTAGNGAGESAQPPKPARKWRPRRPPRPPRRPRRAKPPSSSAA